MNFSAHFYAQKKGPLVMYSRRGNGGATAMIRSQFLNTTHFQKSPLVPLNVIFQFSERQGCT